MPVGLRLSRPRPGRHSRWGTNTLRRLTKVLRPFGGLACQLAVDVELVALAAVGMRGETDQVPLPAVRDLQAR